MDFDFKYKDKIESRQYNQNVLKNIINLIFEKLDILYDIPSEQKVCWIMEKSSIMKAPQKGYEIKDGIHLLFPYIIAEKQSYRVFRNLLIEEDITNFFIQEELTPPSNTMEQIVDEAIYKGGNWFIYGSGKPKENNQNQQNSGRYQQRTNDQGYGYPNQDYGQPDFDSDPNRYMGPQ